MGRYSGKTCRLIFMLVITASFFVAELVSGYVGNSIALVSDSFNMLSDLISLCVGITASRVSRKPRGGSNTFGFPRAEVVGALCNAVFLGALSFTIFVEAVKRLAMPERIDDARLVLAVGALGLAVNMLGLLLFQDCCFLRRVETVEESESGACILLLSFPYSLFFFLSPYVPLMQFHALMIMVVDLHPPGMAGPTDITTKKQRKKDKKGSSSALNIRGVLLHVMGDALGSVVVVVAATIFYLLPLDRNVPCNWQCYIDPSLTVIMVVIILFSAFPLIKETSTILLQMVPKGVDVKDLGEKLSNVPGVQSIHELHIWELSGGKNIATLHVKYSDSAVVHIASCRMREVFHSAGIHAVTIQSELCDAKGAGLACSYPCVSKECESQMCCSQQANPCTGTNGYAEVSTCLAGEVCNDCSSREPEETVINIVTNGEKGWHHERWEESEQCEETSNGITSTRL
ncbi:calcium/manganese antiporter SLC30A10-like [Latimeria chalumnae]|uniref:calcium/manganese antiporter SLC30A10-like n=1 Tax=Latimeria chalumnae TaxID=7897 RepID=UPI00313B6564